MGNNSNKGANSAAGFLKKNLFLTVWDDVIDLQLSASNWWPGGGGGGLKEDTEHARAQQTPDSNSSSFTWTRAHTTGGVFLRIHLRQNSDR